MQVVEGDMIGRVSIVFAGLSAGREMNVILECKCGKFGIVNVQEIRDWGV